MEYSEKYSVANPMRDTYERYLESLAVFVGWLLDREYDVKLLLGRCRHLRHRRPQGRAARAPRV